MNNEEFGKPYAIGFVTIAVICAVAFVIHMYIQNPYQITRQLVGYLFIYLVAVVVFLVGPYLLGLGVMSLGETVFERIENE